MTTQKPHNSQDNEAPKESVQRKVGSFSLFGDEWSALALRKGHTSSQTKEQASAAQDLSSAQYSSNETVNSNTVATKTRRSGGTVKRTKAKTSSKKERKETTPDLTSEVVEGEICMPDSSDSKQSIKQGVVGKNVRTLEIKDVAIEDTEELEGVEVVEPELVQPHHTLHKGSTEHALEAQIVEAESLPTEDILVEPVSTKRKVTASKTLEPKTIESKSLVPKTLTTPALPTPGEVSSTTHLPVVKPVSTALVKTKDEQSKANVTTSATTTTSTAVTSVTESTAVAPKTPKRVVVPDPNITDAELDIKELEVLRQIKEFNARQLEEEQDQESPDQYYDHEDDIEDDSVVSGMHLESHKAQEQGGYDDDEDEYAQEVYDDETPGSKKSRAVVRSAGNIASFIRIANQEPLLTLEQEKFLAERYRQYGDIEAARKLVTSHLRLVISVAHGYTGYGLPLPDLIQEGNVGLMKAVMHFDPDSGRLAAFAVHWIRAEINDYVIRNWRMVKVATTKAQRKLFFNLRQLKKHLGWFTENERQEVATNLGVTTHDVAEMETRLAGLDIGFDLDEDDTNGDKGVAVTVSPSSYLEDESSNFAKNFENIDYSAWQVKKLKEALNALDERSRYIIKRRWLDESKATLQELSSELKVSIERVRQIENNAMSKVKTMLVNEGVSADGEKSHEVPKLPNKTSAKTYPLAKREDSVVSNRKSTKASKLKSEEDQDKQKSAKLKRSSKKTESEAKTRVAGKVSKDHSLVPIPSVPSESRKVTEAAVTQENLKRIKSKQSNKIVDVADC